MKGEEAGEEEEEGEGEAEEEEEGGGRGRRRVRRKEEEEEEEEEGEEGRRRGEVGGGTGTRRSILTIWYPCYHLCIYGLKVYIKKQICIIFYDLFMAKINYLSLEICENYRIMLMQALKS